jgi:CO/xanthine dehydrogenase FAD-binding subunit
MAGRETKRHFLEKLMSKASPISDIRAGQDYRQAMLVVLAERALEKALVRLAA